MSELFYHEPTHVTLNDTTMDLTKACSLSRFASADLPSKMADPMQIGHRKSITTTFFEQRLLQDAAREKQKQRHTLLMNLKERDLRDRPSAQFLRECRQQTVSAQLGCSGDPEETMGGMFGITDVPKDFAQATEQEEDDSHKIGELPSTAICGNDITASCFYVVGELSKNAGVFSPICTILSSLTLYCFRSVYGEVVTALPLNGGIYNLLLNSSTKQTASVAACLTILSYTATGVVSSVSAADYLKCSPMFAGIESDAGLGQLYDNFAWERQPPFWNSIFFGFSSAMLGVSGFETSANFVEEQKPGCVFPKTLRNMWVAVSIINVTLPSLAVARSLSLHQALCSDKSGFALAFLAERVVGLFQRMAGDRRRCIAGYMNSTSSCGLLCRCLPEFFSETNSWRNTPHGAQHYTILVFFGVCSSMCVMLNGDITLPLAAIYSISFLLVMGLFAFCGLWLKINRPTLPREINAHPAFFAQALLWIPRYVIQWFVHKRVAEERKPQWAHQKLKNLQDQGVVPTPQYFTKRANMSQINRALQYIEQNEEARWVIHCYPDADQIPTNLEERYVQILDCVYPTLKVDSILVHGEFSPAMVQYISKRIQAGFGRGLNLGTTSPFFGLSPMHAQHEGAQNMRDDYAAMMPNKSSEDEKDMQSMPILPFNLESEYQNN
eukprot:Skav232796  [mRNA]  locus=scaffold614:296542:305254:+ [translate_table: standard]